VKKERRNSLSCRMRKRKPIEIVADKPSMQENRKPNLMKSNDDWMENEENKRIRRLEKGIDQAMEKRETKEEERMQLIKEEKRERKIMNSERTKSLKPT
jgi:hypothetical protein